MQFIGAQPTADLTYSDVFLVPRRSSVSSRLDVDLSPRDGTPATLPLVASNMNAVTGPRLAATLARRGGLGVLPQDLSDAAAVESVQRVKRQPVHCQSPVILGNNATVADALRLVPPLPGHAVALIDAPVDERDAMPASALPAERFLGLVEATLLAESPTHTLLRDLVSTAEATIGAERLDGTRAAFDAVRERCERYGVETLAVIDSNQLVGVTSVRSALRDTLYRPALDTSGRLAVAAAVGINGDVAARARALRDAGCDVIVVDTAHGHQVRMLRALEAVAAADLGVPIVAGNTVTADGVQDLVSAGASIIKVGVGPGAMCTTRMMTAVGRPQFSAVLDTSDAARELGAHVWADGGVRYPRDVALALAAGSASVMIGSWFAGTVESPGELIPDGSGGWYKESWGMASTKAVQARFEDLDPYERARRELFAEGISSSRISLDPLRPGVEDLTDMIVSGVRSAFTYAGADSLPEFHVRALAGIQSAAGYEEGKALPVSW